VVVEFRLLGPVDVRVDGLALDVGHSRQRCVLAALLVEANRPVPADVLVERVWARRPPRHARTALSGYVSRLRQILAPTGVRIARQPGGYVLAADPMAVDLHRFRVLVAAARAAAADQQAAVHYAQALELWDGEPFATLDTPWVNDLRAALERERRSAELDRHDVELRCGRHAELLPRLSSLAGLHPLDERLVGQLILALYRCGRQADALASYQDLRLSLASELGADPSPPLQQLHGQILRAEDVVTLPAPTHGAPPPAQLPADVDGFAGRDDELADLDALLSGLADRSPTAVVISAVSGSAGVGKTALAVHWAHRVRDRFPDGQLYVDLRGFDPNRKVLDPAEAIRRFLDALGVRAERIPADLDAQTALYRSRLAGRRMLIVLDNARDTAQVRPLLPGTSSCLVVVTSRNTLVGLVAAAGARPIAVDVMSSAAARELLTHRLGDRPAAEPRATDEIIAACAGLPLALTIAAARAAMQPRFPLAGLAAELTRAGSRLDALAADDPATSVRAVLSWSYDALTPEAARVFRLLGLHPGADFSGPAAASIAGLPPAQLRSLLAALVGANLIREHVPGRYTFHDLLRAYAGDLARSTDTAPDRRAAVGRLLDHYVHTAHTANRHLSPTREPIPVPLAPLASGVSTDDLIGEGRASAWLTAERPALLAALRVAVDGGFPTQTWQLAWALHTPLVRRGTWHQLAAVWRTALRAADRLDDPTAQAYAHCYLARAHTGNGCYSDAHAHLGHALDLHARTGDLIGQALTHHHLAVTWERQGDPGRALDQADRALTLYKAAGNRRGQAVALNTVAWHRAQLGDHTRALADSGRALILAQQVGDRVGEAETWDTLGYAHHHLDHHADAVECYQHAVALFQDLGDHHNTAVTLTDLGDVHLAADDPALARGAWQDALAILTELDHPDAVHVGGKLTMLEGSLV
jgi:DNA-binding SARP family transcriptional activator